MNNKLAENFKKYMIITSTQDICQCKLGGHKEKYILNQIWMWNVRSAIVIITLFCYKHNNHCRSVRDLAVARCVPPSTADKNMGGHLCLHASLRCSILEQPISSFFLNNFHDGKILRLTKLLCSCSFRIEKKSL